jgi:hypothetical protein
MQADQPTQAIVPAKISPAVVLVSYGTLEFNGYKPEFSFEDYKPDSPPFRHERLRRAIPQFRAPPLTPIAA